MLKSLIKVRLYSLWKSFLQIGGNKKYVKILMAALMLYAFGAMFFTSGMMYYQLCGALVSSGLLWLYFALAGLSAFCICLLGSVMAADSQLFEAKDNELLLSMPIRAKDVLISRMCVLLTLNYFFILLIALPAGVVYAMQFTVSVAGAAIFIVAFAVLPFLVLPISCFFGWLIALASSKARLRNMFILLFYLLLLGFYFIGYTRINTYIAKIIANGVPLAAAIKKALPPFYLIGNAIADKNPLSLLFYILCAAIPCVLVVALISKNYYKIMMTSKRTAEVKYVEKDVRALSAFSALTKKEIVFFLSRPMYIMNAGIGLIMMMVLVIAAAIKGESILSTMGVPEGLPLGFGTAVCVGVCFCATMVMISAPSVSLEGKCIWIPKSIPVKAEIILRSKIASHIAISLPFVIVSGIICTIAFGGSIAEIATYFLLPLSSIVFGAVFGVVINMKFPKFDWINETVAIKQSASVLITMAGSFGFVITPLILLLYLGIKLSDMTNILLLLFCAVLFIVSYALYALLKKNADEKLTAL